MNRQTTLLIALGAVAVLAIYWLFLLSPKRSELNDTNVAIEDARAEQVRLTSQINQLRDLRRQAPALEAQLAAGEVLIPSDAAVPAILRQFQVAADDAAVRLTSIAPARPEEMDNGLSQMNVRVTVEGSYFQLVDFFRRLEDPTITPRAVLWNNVNIAVGQYPSLTASAVGFMFVLDRDALVAGGGQ